MNTRSAITLLLSLLFGIAAALLAAGWLKQRGNDTSNGIVVAAVDLAPGTRLQPEMLRTVAWPKGSVPEGAFLDLGTLSDRVIRTNLSRGEPVLEPKLAPIGTRGGLSAVIAEGKRAITVRVNDVVGVAGFALPGNYVDVVVNVAEQGSGRETSVSKIVLEKILVLAVAQEASRDDTKPRVVNAVTLEVTPEQAEKLDLARSVGSLSLVLRNQVDVEAGSTHGATRDSLLGVAPAPAPKPAPTPVVKAPAPRPAVPVAVAAVPAPRSTQCVELIRGATKSTECF